MSILTFAFSRIRQAVLVLLLCTGFVQSAQSQGIISSVSTSDRPVDLGKDDTLDHARLAFVFTHDEVDPVTNRSRQRFLILLIGNNLSMYQSYDYFRRDSVCLTKPVWTKREYSAISRKYGAPFSDFIVKQSNPHIMEVHHPLSVARPFLYNDTLPEFSWTMVNETKTVCGYVCKKATTTFRGRNWTAWYTEDIPLNNGPWKFCDLPGLITEVYDDTNTHRFTMVQTMNVQLPILCHKRKYVATTREFVNKEAPLFAEDGYRYYRGTPLMPKDAEGNPLEATHRLFFSPIELDAP